MKKHLLILAGVAFVAVSVYAIEQVRRDAAGLHIGSAATDRIGFRNATPVVKGIIADTAPAAVALTVSTGAANSLATGSISAATGGTLTVSVGEAPSLTLGTMEITYQGVDGSTNTMTVVTNVTITAAAPVTNASIAFATANVLNAATLTAAAAVTNVTVNSVYGYTTSNQLNQVRSAIVNHGLASTDGN